MSSHEKISRVGDALQMKRDFEPEPLLGCLAVCLSGALMCWLFVWLVRWLWSML